jgi:hypothetical protein
MIEKKIKTAFFGEQRLLSVVCGGSWHIPTGDFYDHSSIHFSHSHSPTTTHPPPAACCLLLPSKENRKTQRPKIFFKNSDPFIRPSSYHTHQTSDLEFATTVFQFFLSSHKKSM